VEAFLEEEVAGAFQEQEGSADERT